MANLDYGGLYIFQSRPKRDDEEPTATMVNGRDIVSSDEQETITQANAEIRRREASMLAGLIR